jgi:uncharacterized protein involved in exopolysaccharide biosynthesis
VAERGEASLFDLVWIGWRRRRLVAGVALATAVVGVVLSLLMKPVYRSEVLLAPVQEDSAMAAVSGMASQLGGLAALAGLALPKQQAQVEALATLKSRALAEEFITERKLMPVLFARKWDEKRGKWKSDRPDKIPTMGDALKMFDARVREVREDTKTGLVTLRIDWHDRKLAADWANDLVARANQRLRLRAIAEAEQSTEFLNRELAKTRSVEITEAINRLIEAQIKRKMVANVQPQFAFKVIDPAVPSDRDKRVKPKRKLMVLAFGFAGVLLGMLVALWQEFIPSRLLREGGLAKPERA